MTRIVAAVVVMASLIAAVSFSRGQAKATGKQSGDDESIRCRIWLKDTDLRTDARNELNVTISNNLKTDVTLDSLNVYLSTSSYKSGLGAGPVETSYVAAVNLETKGPLEPRQAQTDSYTIPRTSTRIAPGENKTFTVDLSSLLWGKANASTLPSQHIGSIERGRYRLHVVATRDGQSHAYNSNQTLIKLDVP